MIVSGIDLDAVEYEEYKKRFPYKNFCEMCPIRGKYICNCPAGKVYVRIETGVIWR